MAINPTVQPGDPGHAAHHRALATKTNQLDDLVTTGRLSEDGVGAAIAGAVDGVTLELSIVEDPDRPGMGIIAVVPATPTPVVAPVITTTALNPLTQGVAFSQTLVASGDPTITWFRASGTIPAGLSLSSAGVLSGTPSGSGAYSFTLTASNAAGSDDQVFTGSVVASGTAPVITTTSLNALTQGSAFSQTLAASGSAPITFAVTTGSLPTGLSLSSAGVISGTPSGSGAYSFTVTATNANGSDPQAYTGTIAASSGAPTRTASFGPNGTHYPTRTPWVGDASGWDSDVEVACTWAAIGTAIANATTNFPNGKCRIRVQPGVLPGNGAGSTSTPVLQNLGATGRASRILVVPRDGAFSVSFSTSGRIHNVAGVSFLGFCGWALGAAESAATALNLSNCQDLAWGWSKIRFVNITSTAGTTDGVELVEVVAPLQALRDDDRQAFRNVSAGVTRNVTLDGCYLAPNYKTAGSSAHCDTLQTSGSSETFENLTIRDSALFGSTNAALITTPSTDVDLIHSAIVAGNRTTLRYPAPAEANQFTSGYPVAVNTSSPTVTAVDSIITGQIVPKLASVANTTVISTPTATPVSGSYTVDATALDTLSKVNATIPNPTDTLLQAAWAAL